MTKYTVTMLYKSRKCEIYIGSYSSASAFQMAKLLFPSALVIKADKT
ncbi:MAG: hypothetical protein ABNG98_10175 [Flavobacterium sp.]